MASTKTTWKKEPNTGAIGGNASANYSSHSLTVKDIRNEIEHLFGRQSLNYLLRLINDGLIELASKKQHYLASSNTNLEEMKRWYELDDSVIDIVKVEVLDTNSRFIKVPKLSDPHNIMRGDTDETDDALTSS
tara:strand:+ start:1131 stop:1529 length:399 start_codon:yes stop_codon:yes gene_type:complete